MRQLFDRLSIRYKILAGNAVLLLLFVIGVGLGLTALQGVSDCARRLRLELTPTVHQLSEIRSAGVRVLAETSSLAALAVVEHHRLTHGEPVEGRAAALGAGERDQLKAARERLAEALRRLDAVPLPASRPLTPDYGRMTELRGQLRVQAAALLAQSDGVEDMAAARFGEITLDAVAHLESAEALFERTVSQAAAAATGEAGAVQEAIDARLKAALWVSVGVLLAGAIAGAGGAYLIAGWIAGPLADLRDAAVRIGAGDFQARPRRVALDEVGELAGAIDRMARDLEESLERLARQSRLAALGELAGTVSHELRNPLAAISNSLFTLRRAVPAASGDADRVIQRIERNVERCITIVADFLDFARPAKVLRRPVAIDPWLDELLDDYVPPPEIRLARDLAAGATVALDAERFRRAVLNLLDNAAQAMTTVGWAAPAGGELRLTVRTRRDGDRVTLSIEDTGPGIGPEAMSRVFEPLFTTKSFGVGLGLSAVRRIVDQHDGTIEVRSSAGDGACFSIALLVWDRQAEAPAP